MKLRPPNLDDRSFDDLLSEAKRIAAQRCPNWSDFSPGDPGTTLLELFAHLTDVMLYRLNRLPEKAYVEFLRIMGVRIFPPSAARATLEFSLTEGSDRTVEIPRLTRVAASRPSDDGEPPIFVTAKQVRLDPDRRTATCLAYHCGVIEEESIGKTTGEPGQSFNLSTSPVIARTSDEDLFIGVEMTDAERLAAKGRVPGLLCKQDR
ncbi:MAG: phage baseplate protein, partial [Planctomycetes bacterium]|nr:phage baseplate protein [Planctomycetota bacterium]